MKVTCCDGEFYHDHNHVLSKIHVLEYLDLCVLSQSVGLPPTDPQAYAFV